MTELRLGLDSKTSWHDEYKDSAYIFVGESKYMSANGSLLGTLLCQSCSKHGFIRIGLFKGVTHLHPVVMLTDVMIFKRTFCPISC